MTSTERLPPQIKKTAVVNVNRGYNQQQFPDGSIPPKSFVSYGLTSSHDQTAVMRTKVQILEAKEALLATSHNIRTDVSAV